MWINLDKEQVQVLQKLLDFINGLGADEYNSLLDIKVALNKPIDPVVNQLNQFYDLIPPGNRCNAIDQAFQWLYKETTGHEAMGPVCYAGWNMKNVLDHCGVQQLQSKLDKFIKWYEQYICDSY